MKRFTIFASESWCNVKGGGTRRCLSADTEAFYHSEYHGGGNWKIPGTIENMICTLKNDITPYPVSVLQNAVNYLSQILVHDLPDVLNTSGYESLMVCVIPRAKHENHYRNNQKLFRQTIQNVVNTQLHGFVDGTHNIIRHTDTPTTHLREGRVWWGITGETCTISNVTNQNILLIDDLYTKSVCIDEDAIQALLNKGANSVCFYSVGKTIR